MILSAEQERENIRALELEKFLDQQKEQYAFRKPFNNEVQLLLGNIRRIEPLIPEKGTNGIPATRSKGELKQIVADNVNGLCTNVTVYARSTSNTDLLYAVRYRTTGITEAKDGDVLGIVTLIITAITAVLNEPSFQAYDITADTLADLSKQAQAFQNSIGTSAVIDTGSSLANKELNDVFKAIRANVSNLNLLVTWFNTKNPKFVAGYHKSAAVDHSGIRHSGIEGKVINPLSGAPIEGAAITGEGKNKIALTGIDGTYRLIRLKIGSMKITVTAPGYEPQVFAVKIIRGKILELNIELKGKLITLAATA